MKILSLLETNNVSGGNRELAQGAGAMVGTVIGGRLAGQAGVAGGAALGSVAGGKAYDGVAHIINSSPQITIPPQHYNILDHNTVRQPACHIPMNQNHFPRWCIWLFFFSQTNTIHLHLGDNVLCFYFNSIKITNKPLNSN